MTTKQQLTWDGTNYVATLEDGRTLTVSGDDFAEERLEMAREYYREAHPELANAGKQELADAYANSVYGDNDDADTKAFNELLDPSMWEDNAVEVDEDGDPVDKSINYSFAAWIR